MRSNGIAKAKLSCLSILYDQAKNLNDFKFEKEFKEVEAGLLKEIADAQKVLKNTVKIPLKSGRIRSEQVTRRILTVSSGIAAKQQRNENDGFKKNL